MPTRYLALFLVGLTVSLAGCSTFLPSAGPYVRDVTSAAEAQGENKVEVLELSEPLVRRQIEARRQTSLAEVFGARDATPKYEIGPGDALEITVWEAPPAALFGAGMTDPRGISSTASRVTVLPEQPVNEDGLITMPFAGSIHAGGLSPEQLEQEIARRLRAKAHEPQVVVRVVRNSTNTVTVVGEVNTSARLPLSARGERLLDALAASGGFRQPVGKITIQLTRETSAQGRRVTRVVSQSLDSIVTDPAQNIVLRPGDVITALHQPNSFTVLGATALNQEVSFEAQGISLAQALARAGGLQDTRANATGVFVFRFEDPAVLGDKEASNTPIPGKIPVIYRADLKEPATFFLAQKFQIRNGDLLYVANAQGAELQKFMNLLSGVVLPFFTINNLTN